MAAHAVPPSRLVSSRTPTYIEEGSQAIVRRVVISVVAFVGFILFLFGGLVYMSQTYSPKQYSVQVLLNSLTTPNFHARSTQPLSTTKWEATVTIQNYHKDNRKILIGSLESALLYKENAFACASLSLKSPVKIKSMKQRTVTMRFSNMTCSPEKLPLDYDVLNAEAARERRTGRVRFGLQMRMVVTSGIIRSPFSGRFSMIDTRCLETVDVEFAHGVREGRLVGHDVKMKMNSTMSTHGY